MEARHLRYFCALAEELHYTKAALLLNVSQSSLSHQIMNLEEELGTQLVERTNRRVRLTEAGELFRLRATRILEQIDHAGREATRVGQGDAGPLVIGVVSTAICSYLPALLGRLRHERPHLNIDIREMEPGEQVEALHQETIDIGILFLSPRDSTFEAALISRERLVVALPAAHPAASQDEVPLLELARDTFLIPRQQSAPGYHELVFGTLAEAGVTAPALQPTRLLTTAVFLVAGQLGVALVPESFRQHLRVRGCVYREIAGPQIYADLIGMWRRNNTQPALQWFVKDLHRRKRRVRPSGEFEVR